MRRQRSFALHLVVAPLRRHASRTLLSAAALALSACLATALLTLYRGVERDLRHGFRGYGPNLVVVPAAGHERIAAAAALPALRQYPDSAGALYAVTALVTAPAHSQPVIVAGADLPRLHRLNPAWKITGSLPRPGEAWIGSNVAHLFGLHPGASVELVSGSHPTQRWRIVGTVQSGEAQDNQILAPYAQVAALAGRTGYSTLEFRLPGSGSQVVRAAAALRTQFPHDDVRAVRAITAGEAAVLLSTRSMLVSTGLLIGLTIGLCVAAVLTTVALQRRREFALMRALGGSGAAIGGMFFAEAALQALLAGAVGVLAGAAAAGLMGESLFGVWLWPSVATAGLALGGTLILAAAAALAPWPIVQRAVPAALLGGE